MFEDKNKEENEKEVNDECLSDENNSNSSNKKEKKVSISKYNSVLNENFKLKSQVEEWKNKYYSTYADMDNLRKSIEKDHREAMKYRATGFVEKLLPPLDSFNLAIRNDSDNETLQNFLQGFRYIYKNFIQALEEEGVSEIVPVINQKFDEKTMHAIDVVISDGPENMVAKVYANGYKLHDRIIRPAMVYVTKKEQPKENEENNDSENINKTEEKCD